MIEAIEKVVDKEIEMLRELSMFSKKMELAGSAEEKSMLQGGMQALAKQINSLNANIPGLLAGVKIEEKGMSVNIPEKRIVQKAEIGMKKTDALLEELNIREQAIRKLKRKKTTDSEENVDGFKEASGYVKTSNSIFLGTAQNLLKKGYFEGLPNEIKKANLGMLSESYISVMLFSTFLSIFAALAVAAAIIFLGFAKFAIAAIIIPFVVFFALYYYPSAERGAIEKNIDDELPFAVIHMSSISGSGIEPTEIFRIIGLSRDYPYLRKEIRKILNQINIYGYDLVTALGNVSKTTSSARLSELLNGLSATINSGGNLSEFFEKRADTLMSSYKLDKEKFIKVAETFMDIYIAVVIAAPMILMLLLVMISVSGIQSGFTPQQLTIITISGVALINVFFLVFLQTKRT